MSLGHDVTLVRSGLRVGPVCLGAMTLGGDLGFGAGASESVRIADRCFELGGNFIDTANRYTKGPSEKSIGDHVGHARSGRDRLVIATKFGLHMDPGDPNGGGASRKAVFAACGQSLRRCQPSALSPYAVTRKGDHD